jgi:hypothetical protein
MYGTGGTKMKKKYKVVWGDGFTQDFVSKTDAIKAVAELLRTYSSVTIKTIYNGKN